MPTTTFTASVAIGVIRLDPTLVGGVLRLMTDLPLPRETVSSLNPTDLADNLSGGCLPETVVLLSDAVSGAPALAVVVEPGDRDSDTIEYAWPLYLAAVRAILECPTALLVLAPDLDDAKRCRRVIAMGQPGFDLSPIVIGPGNPSLP